MSETTTSTQTTATAGAKAAGGDTDPYNARVVGRIDMTPDLALFQIAYEDAEVPDFTPGQFATLGVIQSETPEQAAKRRRPGPKLLRRAYSIASSPKVKGHIEFYIALVDEGQLTPKLWQLREGDRLFMDTKIKGHFTMEDVPDGKDLIMVSTGTGLAPFLSMVDTYRDQPGRWNKLVFIHGVRYASDLGYRDKLEKIAAEDPNIHYIPAVTREPENSDYDGPRGRCQTVLTQPILDELGGGAKLHPDHAHVFLCGNPAMIDQCEVELTQLGFTVKDRKNPDGNVHFERYW